MPKKQNADNHNKARTQKDLNSILSKSPPSRQLSFKGLENPKARLIEKKHRLLKSKQHVHNLDALLMDQYQLACDDFEDLKSFPINYSLSKQERCALHTRTKRQINSIDQESFKSNPRVVLDLLNQIIKNCNVIIKLLTQSQKITLQDFRRFLRTAQLEVKNFLKNLGGRND